MRPHTDELRTSMKNLVDALRDKHSEVTLIGFGSAAHTITPLVDVSADDGRGRLKDDIDNLETFSGEQGGTNWDAAFTALGPQQLNLVVIITDGVPTAYGAPAQGSSDSADSQPLNAAVAAADRLKAGGTRIVAVGIGLGQTGASANLAKITGPVDGSDYYASQVTDLLHQLYDIAAKACGVPISALPTPEPPSFPLARVLLLALGALLVLAVAGFLLYRRRRPAVPATPVSAPPAKTPPTDPTIRHDDILRDITEKQRNTPAQSPKRSMSLDFLRDNRPTRDE